MNRKRKLGILLGVLILLLSGCTGNIGSESVAPTTEPPVLQVKEAKSETLTEEEPDPEAAAEPETERESEPEYESKTASESETESEPETETETEESDTFDLALIPEYSGVPYTELNDNIPLFQKSDFQTKSFESYSELDQLGRCGVAFANIGEDLMPTEPREEIGAVHPSGWHTINYHELIDGNYLYNRCHLIAYQLTGENANEKNLITGIRYMNAQGMEPFESRVADYIHKTGNHVLYRVTPIFEGENLVASGVEMEAESVEDEGAGIRFHIFVYNVQPGITIRYSDGESRVAEEPAESEAPQTEATESKEKESETEPVSESGEPEVTYILNRNTRKFHQPNCPSVDDIKESNKIYSTETREEILENGYEPCKRCNP